MLIQQFLPLIIISIPLAIICYLIAKEKGKNAGLFAILGIIPVLNWYVIFYLIGSVNHRVEEKLDIILKKLNKKENIKKEV